MSNLIAVGVFWDIENCCVPKGKSALKIIERIRERFFEECREAEFICVCDISKESDSTIQDLNDGQINVVHINATAKNAADDKIRQSLRRFSDSHPPGTKVILISSDVNFASDLSDLRYRKRYHVVLIHKAQVSEALLSCATEHFLYEDLIKDLPYRPGYKEAKDCVLVICGYSKDEPLDKVKNILKMLSNNCGGKVLSIGALFAVLKFDTPDLLERAKKRMNSADVCGKKISVSLPEETPFFNTVRKLTAAHLSKRQESPSPQRKGKAQTRSRSHTPLDLKLADTLAEYYSGMSGVNSYQTWLHQGGFSSSRTNYLESKAPGGPVCQQQDHVITSSVGSQGNSPSHTHTLPNSNSAKYYSTKSGPVTQDHVSYGLSAGNVHFHGPPKTLNSTYKEASFVIGDLSNAASSRETITVFKPAELKSLTDIPIPSFGFRDIPPPTMPTLNVGLDPNAASFDPIKVIETASKDTVFAMTSVTKSSFLGPDLQLDHPESQPSLQQPVKLNYSVPNNQIGIKGTSHQFTSSQNSAFTKHQPAAPSTSSSQQQQSRSKSVPIQSPGVGKEKLSIEDEICLMHGYPPSSAFRSHSQNSGVFKKPASPYKFKNPHNSGGPSRHSSPVHKSKGYRSNSREHRQSLSSDGEDRSYSPTSNVNTAKHDFRSRLASAPGSVSGMSSDPNNCTQSPLTGRSPIRVRPKHYGSNLYRVPTPHEIGDPCTDYLHPEFNFSKDPFVELIVSNLDYNIQPREWRKIIYATFHPHVKILSIQVRLQADNTSVATVRLPSEQDARFAISQFHRRKIGYKRINVQLKTDTSQSPADSLRTDTVALLMEAKDNKLALSRLIDLFDKRFHKTVSVSDVFKMRDTIQIIENGGAGRWVKLQPGIRRSPTPSSLLEKEMGEPPEQPVCSIHCAEGSVFYTEALNACMLPNVVMLRKHFSPQLHSLLLSHNGYIPLMSFPACFAAEFKTVEPAKEGGIPLEHVISCVPGVEITVSKVGVKVIQFQENRDQFYDMMKGNSWQELGKISREVMELLRQQPTCSMPVSKFIPAYHHYFGKQCRVADYGYTKLQELFEAIPHAIQVLGAGDRKAITLSPRAQLKRFTTDILKVVKAQPTKQLFLEEFPLAYEKVMGKALYLQHYGVSFMEDVLTDIPTTTLIVIEEGSQTLLALPRRDQTPEEVERTKQFALEVVDLLKHNPQCRMPFNKFIPAYHHHFGRQCRVADYGFSKLTDLFEAVAHVAEIEDEGEERLIHLSAAELRKVLCEQLTSLLRPVGSIPLNKILTEYAKHFGFCLKLEEFGAESVKALLLKLKNHIKIEVYNGQEHATLVKVFQIPQVGLQVMQLLMDETGGSLPLIELCMRYETLFHVSCDINKIKEELNDFVQIDDGEFDTGGVIRLTSQQMLGRNLRLLLLHHDRILLNELLSVYHQQYGVELSPALYGFSSLYQLLLAFPHILAVKGKPLQKYITLSSMLATPGTLPPARVDVTSPSQYSSSSSGSAVYGTESTSNSSCDMSSHSSPTPASTCDLLRHASKLWDPNLALEENDQSPPQRKNVTQAMSANGVPLAWQMKAGGERVVSGNLSNKGMSNTTDGITGSTIGQIRILSRNPGGDVKAENHWNSAALKVDGADGDIEHLNDIVKVWKVEELFSASSSSLESSSINSQETMSSSSFSASPIKRKTRLVANFSAPQS